MGLSKDSRWVLKRIVDPRDQLFVLVVLVDKIVEAGLVNNTTL
jgi:hypothetical protein